jgi:hypothetical protein
MARAARRKEAFSDPEQIAESLENELGNLVEIRLPADCDEPILSLPVRQAVSEWMVEARMRDELAAVGVKPRQTCLLQGPPGTGKTTLAHHFAARLGYALVVTKGENIVGSHLGESGRNISRLFAALKKHEGNIIGFIDEIDSIGTTRTDDNQACAREQNAMVTALLTNIEAFNGLFFAATNRGDKLDPALWRRFGMQIEVGLPDFDGRFAIMKRYAKPFDFDDDLLDELAMLTNGAAPSLLRQLIEGVKRILILGPKLRRDISDPVSVFAGISAQVAPHPFYMDPPNVVPLLWGKPESVDRLAGKAWPPMRAV